MAPGFKNATEILGMANARKRVPVLIPPSPEQFGIALGGERLKATFCFTFPPFFSYQKH